MIRIAIGLVLALVLGIHGHARADEATCIKPDDFANGIISAGVKTNVAIERKDLTGMEVKAVMARLNAIPPETQYTSDHIIVLAGRRASDNAPLPGIIISFFENGCLKSSGVVPLDEAAKILQ